MSGLPGAEMSGRQFDDRVVTVADDAGSSHAAVLSSWRTPEQTYGVRVQGPWGTSEGIGPDLFEALVDVRRQLEPDGWRLLVQGARRDAHPSGMQRDQGQGFSVLVLRAGEAATREDVRETFAPAELGQLGSVDEQERNWQKWLAQRPGGGRR